MYRPATHALIASCGAPVGEACSVNSVNPKEGTGELCLKSKLAAECPWSCDAEQMTNTGDKQHFDKTFAGERDMAKAPTESMFSVQHVKSSETETEQLSYFLEIVQQYEEECLLSSRNKEEAEWEEPPVSV